MTQSRLIRLAGAALLMFSLAIAAPALAIPGNTGGGGGGGGGDGGSGGGSGGSSSSTTHSTAVTSSTPTLAQGQADLDAHNWVKAISDLKLFLKANPKSADGWNLLGFAYRNHGDLKLSDTSYDRALKLNPNHTGALSYQGILYIKLGKVDEAKGNLAKIETICGNTTCAAYVALAKALG